jgi:hypothetical protein
MHNRSQSSSGPNFSPAPIPYSASLDEFFMNSLQARQAAFMFEDNPGDNGFDALNVHSSEAHHSYAAALNTPFMPSPNEVDDSVSLQSGYSNSSNFGIQ